MSEDGGSGTLDGMNKKRGRVHNHARNLASRYTYGSVVLEDAM